MRVHEDDVDVTKQNGSPCSSDSDNESIDVPESDLVPTVAPDLAAVTVTSTGVSFRTKTPRELCRALYHPGPIVTLALIQTITITASYCSIMWWPPASSIYGALWLFVFFLLSGMTLYNFLAAMSVGPGQVPCGWKPKSAPDLDKVQYCAICQSYKAPRAHHCRKCGKCVLKMDHHCPWINECVGHRNHAHFVAFLVSATYGCSQATVIISFFLYHALFRVKTAPIIQLSCMEILIWYLFVLGCAFGVSLGTGVLLVYQLKGIWSNRTGVEEWIEEKAYYRRKAYPDLPPYKNPYNFGVRTNFRLIFNLQCEPNGDGILWPVIPTADQYTMTVEQIEQKKDKQRRVQQVVVTEVYTGSWFPIRKGCCVAFRPPCSDDPRIPLQVGQQLLVSRWKQYWLYGEKIPGEGGGGASSERDVVKGWFPRRCVAIPKRHRPTCENYMEPCHDHDLPPDPDSDVSHTSDTTNEPKKGK